MDRTKALAALFFTVAVWGIGPVFLRTLSVDLGPADHLVIRYALVAVIYLAALLVSSTWRIERRDLPRLLLVSLVGMVGYNLGSAFGFETAPAGVGSLIIGTQPLLIAILAALVAHERLTGMAVLGLLIGLSGIVTLFWNDLTAANANWPLLRGASLIFLSGLAWAVYVVAAKPLIRKYGTFPVSALSITIATAVMIPALASRNTILTLETMTLRNWLDMAYMVIPSTLIATLTWNYGASRLSAATTGATLYLVPVIGVIAGAVMLAEPILPATLAGGGLILLGVAIAQFRPRKNSRAAGHPEPERQARSQPSPRLIGIAAVLFAVTMWGLIPVAMRYLILDIDPPTVMILRLFPAGVIAAIAVTIVGVRRIATRDWIRICIAALAGNLGYQILAAYGMQTVPASWTGMLFGLEPVFIALFAVIFAGDRLTPWLIAGIAVALAGTAALMLGSLSGPPGEVGLFGLILVTLSTMGWGIYTVVIRPVALKYGGFETACLAMAISALPMVAFVTPQLPQALMAMTATHWIAVGYVVIFGTFLATSAWNFALGRMSSSVAGMFLYVQPVVAALGGILLLGERLSLPLLTGGGLIILGVAMSQFGPEWRMGRLRKEILPADTGAVRSTA
jgi:drug/metabolite transporter (DMT)-like permease